MAAGPSARQRDTTQASKGETIAIAVTSASCPHCVTGDKACVA
jgi:hypothetical protein